MTDDELPTEEHQMFFEWEKQAKAEQADYERSLGLGAPSYEEVEQGDHSWVGDSEVFVVGIRSGDAWTWEVRVRGGLLEGVRGTARSRGTARMVHSVICARVREAQAIERQRES